MTLGERIIQLRKEKGWSQEDLGSQVGVSRQAVSRWESDQAVPETEKIVELSRLFGVSAGVLLGTEERTEAVITENAPVPQKKSARKKSWVGLLGGILTAAVIFGVTAHQNAQIRDLQNSLNSLQGMYGNLSYQMDRMNSDLADTIEGLLVNQYTVFAEYSLAVDSIDRDAGTFRVRVNGVLRNPADSVRFFARDSKDAIYTGSIDILDEQSSTVSGTVDVPLERGIRFYAANGTETMHITVRSVDLYEFTLLGVNLYGWGYSDMTGTDKLHIALNFSVNRPVVKDSSDTLSGAVTGKLKVIRNGETVQEIDLVQDTSYVDPDRRILTAVMNRTEPLEDPEEYLLYAEVTDQTGRQFAGYVTMLQLDHKSDIGFMRNIPVDPETGEIR